MSGWRKDPPSYDEWLNERNHGAWWIKFKLCDEHTDVYKDETITFPEVWHTEVVVITCSHPKGFRSNEVKLHAHSAMGRGFDLDDPKATKRLYWQAVVPPANDDDKEPTV